MKIYAHQDHTSEHRHSLDSFALFNEFADLPTAALRRRNLILVILNLCSRKTRAKKLELIVMLSFSKSSVFKEMFSVHRKTKKPAFSNSSGLKGVFENFRFRDD